MSFSSSGFEKVEYAPWLGIAKAAEQPPTINKNHQAPALVKSFFLRLSFFHKKLGNESFYTD